jgi:hypothetical protein
VTSAIQTQINTKAPTASPTFTGDPLAPTALTADNDTSIATTAFVKAQSYITAASETDPQVGTITTGYVPRSNGTSLNDGVIRDDASTVGI